LIDLLVAQRLLSTDVAKETGEVTIEPVHEALLRQWGLLQGWLAGDSGLLGVLAGIKRASRDWAANDSDPAWLTHSGDRLKAAERLVDRPDLSGNLEPTDLTYLASCREAEQAATLRKRRLQALAGVLVVLLALGGIGWAKQGYLREQGYWHGFMRPALLSQADERALQPGQRFAECKSGCPEMVVIPNGSFLMGSPEGTGDDDEHPQHEVTIAAPFAAGRHEVTFEQWDACVASGTCPKVSPSGWGRGKSPVINVSWDNAKRYVAWLSRVTGKPYRLLSEAEWEYASRAGSTTSYPSGEEESGLEDYAWYASNSGMRTHPVGKRQSNAFGLFDRTAMCGSGWRTAGTIHMIRRQPTAARGKLATATCAFTAEVHGPTILATCARRTVSKGRRVYLARALAFVSRATSISNLSITRY
jgi:formylglycine-generating enzyme required for sulfatase activity